MMTAGGFIINVPASYATFSFRTSSSSRRMISLAITCAAGALIGAGTARCNHRSMTAIANQK